MSGVTPAGIVLGLLIWAALELYVWLRSIVRKRYANAGLKRDLAHMALYLAWYTATCVLFFSLHDYINTPR